MVGIKFKTGGKIYDFDPGAFVLAVGDAVIVETEKGLGFGTVAVAPEPLDGAVPHKTLKKVFRKATDQDFSRRRKNMELEKEAHEQCLKFIAELKLKMNLFIGAEFRRPGIGKVQGKQDGQRPQPLFGSHAADNFAGNSKS